MQFYDTISRLLSVVQNIWTVAELKIIKYMEGSGRALIETVSRHFPTSDQKLTYLLHGAEPLLKS